MCAGWYSYASQELEEGQQHSIYVSSISWHTAIIVPGYTIPDSLWVPEYEFQSASYLEIGWGEADFYPHDGFNIWYAIKSALWPTGAVVHINPLHGNVESYYSGGDVVRMEINDEQLEALRQFLVESFELDKAGQVIPAAAGKHSRSHFFRARESYYFPKNSNVWVAKALKSAGFPIRPFWQQTTQRVLKKAAKFGEKL
jgi:uncharacterized protein (TIGR02117 family)